jgi:hypothetical protein
VGRETRCKGRPMLEQREGLHQLVNIEVEPGEPLIPLIHPTFLLPPDPGTTSASVSF